MTYTIETTDLEDAALTAFVERENAHAPVGQVRWASNQAYVTAQAARAILDPLTSLFVEAVVTRLGTQARQATLAELEAADAALPDQP